MPNHPTLCPKCWGSTLFHEYVPTRAAVLCGVGDDCAWCEGAGVVNAETIVSWHQRGLVTTADFITAIRLTPILNGDEYL